MSVRENVAWGIRYGLYFAVAFSLLAAVPALIRTFSGPGSETQRIPSFLALLSVYFFGGIMAGTIVGLFRPVVTRWWGALIVGTLASVPISFAMGMMSKPIHLWTGDDVRTNLEFAGMWGSVMSLSLWWAVMRALRQMAQERDGAP